MPNVVGVRFRPTTKIYYFDPGEYTDLAIDDRVIVETSRGTEMGLIILPPQRVSKDELKGSLKQVVRKATPVDLVEAEKYRAKEPEALEKCKALAKEMKLPIKVLEADYNFDGSRLVLSFFSEQRVDFRDLAKELGRSLRTRIEMKQIGARDETKILNGHGRCGRRLCCSSWLTDFHPVSIRMAKRQSLPLAPSEISGICGRLLCCLAYEDDFYAEITQQLPRVNSRVKTQQGVLAKVRGVNVLKETLLLEVEAEDGETYIEVAASEVEPVASKPAPQKTRRKQR
ncbi:MAG: stage 0 sporulation family protein [Anaerolineae bacterium]|nr:stage 0 sporulation family protein [Anaerolineae bacterium]